MACGDLIKSSVVDCENPIQGGVGDNSRLILINKKDIDSYTLDGTGRITAITLKSGKSGWSFDGVKQSLKPKYEKVDSPTGQPLYRHTAEFFYFGYSAVDKNNLQQMANGRYVAIFSNAKSDENAYEALGLDIGVEIKEMVRASQENGGAIRVVLASPSDNELEAKMPATISTAYATAKTLVENLLYLPTITSFTPTAGASAGGTAITATCTNLHGGGSGSVVTKVDWVNTSTGAVVNQATFSVVSDVSLTCTTPAMAVGSYYLRITTTKGQATSSTILIVT